MTDPCYRHLYGPICTGRPASMSLSTSIVGLEPLSLEATAPTAAAAAAAAMPATTDPVGVDLLYCTRDSFHWSNTSNARLNNSGDTTTTFATSTPSTRDDAPVVSNDTAVFETSYSAVSCAGRSILLPCWEAAIAAAAAAAAMLAVAPVATPEFNSPATASGISMCSTETLSIAAFLPRLRRRPLRAPKLRLQRRPLQLPQFQWR